jgi:hypothetical protein
MAGKRSLRCAFVMSAESPEAAVSRQSRCAKIAHFPDAAGFPVRKRRLLDFVGGS